MALLCSWGFTPVEDAERAGHSVVAAFLRGSAAQANPEDPTCDISDGHIILMDDKAPLLGSPVQNGSNYGSHSGAYVLTVRAWAALAFTHHEISVSGISTPGR
jgi:hypothetical protein